MNSEAPWNFSLCQLIKQKDFFPTQKEKKDLFPNQMLMWLSYSYYKITSHFMLWVGPKLF